MTFPSSGCTVLVGQILNTTAPLALANSILVGNPLSNSYLIVNAVGFPSGSLLNETYGPAQGNDPNPSGSIDAIVPQVMVQLHNLVLQQSMYSYRM
jgi:hypothetical protein